MAAFFNNLKPIIVQLAEFPLSSLLIYADGVHGKK
jgi:hypothetical protein